MAKLFVGTENGSDVLMHYEDVGSGPPVILIHGWLLSGRAWEPQVPSLVDAGYRVITIDRRGYGKSSQPWGGHDYDTWADDIGLLIDHLGLEGVTLVGFSMAGGEVARYVARHGTSRLAGAVLASSVTPFLHITADNPQGGVDDASLQGIVDAMTDDRVAFVDGFLRDYYSTPGRTDLISEQQRQYHLHIAEFASPRALIEGARQFSLTDFRADLAGFDVPTLIIHGSGDVIVPFDVSARRTHEAIAGSELVVIEGAPHGMNATHPAEFNAALLGFLVTAR